jgi:hypothetical protein
MKVEIDYFVFGYTWLTFLSVITAQSIGIFILYFCKSRYSLWFETYKHAKTDWDKLRAYAAALWEPVELLLDLIYIYRFPHYNWITVGLLWVCLLSSFSTSVLWFW